MDVDEVEPRVASSVAFITAQATMCAVKTIEKVTQITEALSSPDRGFTKVLLAPKERAAVIERSQAVVKSGLVQLSQQLRFFLPLSVTLLPLFLFRHPSTKNADTCSCVCQRARPCLRLMVDINVLSAVRPLLVLNTCSAIDGDTWQMHHSMPAQYVIRYSPDEMRS